VSPASAAPGFAERLGCVRSFALGRPTQHGLKRSDRVSENGWVPPSLYGKEEGPVEPGQLVLPEPLGLPLAEANSGDTFTPVYLIVQRHGVSAQVQTRWQSLEAFADRGVYQLGLIDGDPGSQEVVPAGHSFQLLPYAGSQ
jgi:hypothetical protein